MRNVQKVAFCDRSFSFLHPAVWTYGAKKFVIQVTITSKGACFSSSQVLNWKHDSCRERERKKNSSRIHFHWVSKKKNVLEISHSPRGVCFFLGREEKTLNLQKKRQHSICKKKTFMTKFAINVEKSWKKKRINLLLKAMIHHNESEVRGCWTDGREYGSTSC